MVACEHLVHDHPFQSEAASVMDDVANINGFQGSTQGVVPFTRTSNPHHQLIVNKCVARGQGA